MYSILKLAALLAVLSIAAHAQSPQHKFWDRYRKTTTAITVGVASYDAGTTAYLLSKGGDRARETHPLLRRIIGNGGKDTFIRVTAYAVGFDLGVGYLFHRLGWHRWETVMTGAQIGANSFGAAWNTRQIIRLNRSLAAGRP